MCARPAAPQVANRHDVIRVQDRRLVRHERILAHPYDNRADPEAAGRMANRSGFKKRRAMGRY